MRKALSIAIIVMSAMLAGQAHAVVGTPIITPIGVSIFNGDGPWTLGYTFVASSSLSITALGAFDEGHNGFQDAHTVGLWDASGNLLASAAVASSDTLIGDFRYTAVSSVHLSAGNTYYVGASNFGVNDAYGYSGTVTSAPGITYGSSAFSTGSALQFPSRLDSGRPGFYGGNLLVSSVPEPETYGMLLAGLGLLGTVARRRSAAKQS